MKRKLLLLLLTVLLCVFTFSVKTDASEFEGKEDYYNGICNGYIAPDSENRAVCEKYKQYLTDKKNNANEYLQGIKNEISAVGSDLAAIQKKSKQIAARMESIYAEFETSQAQIKSIEDGVKLVEKSIVEKTEAAEKRKQLILDRIPALAVKANTNQYIDFIMGASDLVDLIQRSSSIETFTKYDKEMITSYQEEIKLLEAEHEEQIRLKDQLVAYQEDLKLQEEELKVMYEANQQLASSYHAQQEDLMAKKTEAERLVQAANASANRITFTEPITGSSGMASPIPSGYTSAGTWAYPGGALHRGLDKAVPIGTAIYAPANGVVLSARTGVNSSGGGYLGNMAGYPYGGGNTLHILVEAGGQVYGVTFAHMSPMIISSGTRISQGQLIGYTGNTGNSTGPHCHIEVYKLNMDFEKALNYWNTNFDWAWGCSWNAGASCSSAGCRIRPESLGW